MTAKARIGKNEHINIMYRWPGAWKVWALPRSPSIPRTETGQQGQGGLGLDSGGQAGGRDPGDRERGRGDLPWK